MPATVNKIKKEKSLYPTLIGPGSVAVRTTAVTVGEQATRTTASPLTAAPGSALSSWALLWRSAIASSC